MEDNLLFIFICCLCIFVGVVVGFIIGRNLRNIEIIRFINLKTKEAQKFNFLYEVSSKLWLIKDRKREMSKFFLENSFEHIAIYGMGKIGQIFLKEMQRENILVEYVVDRNANNIQENIHKYTPDDILPDVDILIVTIWDIQQVRTTVDLNENCKIVSINDLLDVIMD